jgi:regulatory protein
MPERTAYVDGLRLLGRRELSVKQLRERLLDRDHSPEDADRAVALLLENRALDDARVAAAYVRTALAVKGRGRLRIRRELQEMGIDAEVAGAALADAFGNVDERSLVKKALAKKLRGKKMETAADYARVFQFLMRQGYSPATVTAVLRESRRTPRGE